MSDVVRVSGPIGLHLGKEVSLEDALRLADRCFDRLCFLRVELAVICPVKAVESRCDRVQ